jgi:hypothetical protein
MLKCVADNRIKRRFIEFTFNAHVLWYQLQHAFEVSGWVVFSHALDDGLAMRLPVTR